MMAVFLRSIWSIGKIMTIIYTVNYMTLKLQKLAESIFTQSYIQDQEKDKQVISFHGLMLIQKAFILLLASVTIWLVSKLVNDCKDNKIDGQHEFGNEGNQINQITQNQSVSLKYQILIGFFTTASTLVFAQVQQKLWMQQLSIARHAGYLFIFILVHFWFLSKSQLMKISLNNIFFKIIYLTIKTYQFYYLVSSTHFIVYRIIPYDHYYAMWFEQFNIGGFGDYSFSAKPDLWLALFLEAGSYFTIYLLKNNYFTRSHNQVYFTANSFIESLLKTLIMLRTLVKYAVVTLILYSLLVVGDLGETISFLANYPEGYYTLIKYSSINFIIYLLYAHCIVSYPPSVFMIVFITRRAFEKWEVTSQKEQFKDYTQMILAMVGLMLLELIQYEWFDERQKMNVYNKVNERVNDDVSFSGRDGLEMTTTQHLDMQRDDSINSQRGQLAASNDENEN